MKKLKKILEPRGPVDGDHPDPPELAAFLDGRLSGAAREEVVRHLSLCRECYEVVQESLGDLETERAAVRRVVMPGRRRWLAMAASVVLCLLVASGLYYYGGIFAPQQAALTASVELDNELTEMLLEDESLEWTGEKARRFVDLLTERGVEVAAAKRVELVAAYDPYRPKDLKAKKEKLSIRVADDVIHVEIKGQESH